MSARMPGSLMELAMEPISWGRPGDSSTTRPNCLMALAISASVSLSLWLMSLKCSTSAIR